MGKKAIITGVTGQDGSYLAELLLSKGYTVIGLTRRTSTDNTGRLRKALTQGLLSLPADITDVHSLHRVFKEHKDVDEVYNLAAQSHVHESFKQPALTWDVTGKGVINILQTLVDLDINAKFYQAGSSEMFGANYDIIYGHTDGAPHHTKCQNENTKFMPQSPYAISKCAAHYATRLYREAYDMFACSGILFNHESARRGDTFVTKKITNWIRQFSGWCQIVSNPIQNNDLVGFDDNNIIYRGHKFPKLRLGNLDASRDWGYAPDFVEAMWLMLQQDRPDDYVICTGKTRTIREFLDAAFNCIGIFDWSNYVIQDPEFYRPAEVDYLRGDCSKARRVLGWEPKTSFEDMVREMVNASEL